MTGDRYGYPSARVRVRVRVRVRGCLVNALIETTRLPGKLLFWLQEAKMFKIRTKTMNSNQENIVLENSSCP